MNIKELCEQHNLSFICIPIQNRPDKIERSSGSRHYRIVVKNSAISETFYYSTGSAIKITDITLERVMESILLDYSALDLTLEEWADEYGYSSDSRRAEEIYKACLANAEKLARLLGGQIPDDVEIE